MREKCIGMTPEEKIIYAELRAKIKKSKGFRAAWTGHLGGARQRGIETLFTEAIYMDFIRCPCEYCGAIPAGGVDRLDSHLTYVPENCVPCCAFCNRARNSVPLNAFEGWLSQLVAYRLGVQITPENTTHELSADSLKAQKDFREAVDRSGVQGEAGGPVNRAGVESGSSSSRDSSRMGENGEEIAPYVCLSPKCGHVWFRRSKRWNGELPKECPRCKRKEWADFEYWANS